MATNHVRAIALVELDVALSLPLPELVEYARKEMYIRLQQGKLQTKQIEIMIE